MKIIGLDMGDRWVGTAISDELGITARPYRTVEHRELVPFLKNVIREERIEIIVVGYPKTMGGRESEQTKKIVSHVDELKQEISEIEWVLWDERLSSKQAAGLKKTKTKDEKIASHSIAAALILKTYLDYLDFKKQLLTT